MPSILNLKFKGNKSFVAFSNLNDAESLTQTWKVCTKVASFLEQGQRLENLSWRLWHLQNLIVDTDNAKSRREFRKLSKCMGDKLDKEKGRSIEELSAPDFKRNHSTDMIRQRAAEKERNREVNQHAGGTIKRMQFTFSVDQPSVTNTPVKKPDTRPSAELSKRSRASALRAHLQDSIMSDSDIPSLKSTASDPIPVISAPTPQSPSQALYFPSLFNDSFGPSALLYAAPTLTTTMTYGEGYAPSGSSDDQFRISRPTIEVPLDEILFDDDCSDDSNWASAINILCGAATAIDITPPHPSNDPVPNVAVEKTHEITPSASPETVPAAGQLQEQDVIMLPVDTSHTSDHSFIQHPVSDTPPLPVEQQYSSFSSDLPSSSSDTQRSSSVSGSSSAGADDESVSNQDFSDDEDDLDERSPAPSTARRTSIFKNLAPISDLANPETVAPSRLHSIYGTRSSTPNTSRPTLTLKTQGTMTTRSSGPGATLTSLNPAILRGNNNNHGPGGVKAECSNCGATHTPLWRRGLNDELNCNACGLYCKLHKRPRPKSMRNAQGETRAPTTPRLEPVEVVGPITRPRSLSTKAPPFTENPPPRQSVTAQCYNCHTTATPLWRKDDEGKTVCNACGLYYKLHGSARPISMKSDIIRKRSRHDARRSSQSGLDDFPPSPGFSHRTSPVRDTSPTLAPDSTTQMSYDFDDATEFRSTSSELVGALGNPTSNGNGNHTSNDSNGLYNSFPVTYSGPCHPDYLIQLYSLQSDPLPFSGAESTTGSDPSMSPRSNKRRRMSTDSASEPPSSAASFSSFGGSGGMTSNGGDGYTSASSTSSHHSRKGSMDFPFPTYNSNGTINQGPALRGPGNTFWHPPMMPQPQSDTETFWHPPLVPPTKTNTPHISKRNDYSSSSDDSSESCGPIARSCSKPAPGKTEDSTMDFLHALHDDELFSAYLHPHDEKTAVSNVEGGHPMYVDSFFR